MNPLIRLAKTPITTHRLDARLGQMVCFVGAILLFAAAVLKLCSLRLTEGELVIGLLAAIACTLQLVVIGLLLGQAAARHDLTPNGIRR